MPGAHCVARYVKGTVTLTILNGYLSGREDSYGGRVGVGFSGSGCMGK